MPAPDHTRKDTLPIEQKVGGLWGERPGLVTYKHIPALRMLRQKDSKFEAYIVRYNFKKKSKTLAS